MRILWITADVLEPFFPFVEGSPSRGGSWIGPLFFSLAEDKNNRMGVLSPVLNGKNQTKEIDGIIHFSIPMRKNGMTRSMSKAMSVDYLNAISNFKPDIIHIHGIEKNYGLLRKYVDSYIPIACSIQGVINACLPALQASAADICLEKFRSIKNKLGRGGVNYAINNWTKYIPIEQEITKINQYFIGRTTWDKAQIKALNPKAYYFHGEELLREVFYTKEWDLNICKRHQVFVSSAAYPLKGFHIVLKAIALLKDKYPNIKLVAPFSSVNMDTSFIWDFLFAEDYARYLKNEISRLGLKNNITSFKRLTADQMANCFTESNVFVLSSFIENSSNALGEAMAIGTPTIVTPVGGVMSIVTDNESTLMFPSGDHAFLAYQIDVLFSNDQLAIKLSDYAKKIANKRHNILDTTTQYLDIYKQIIRLHNENLTSLQ
jgi:glycosyltransferase involved in cell wall biosynthesis